MIVDIIGVEILRTPHMALTITVLGCGDGVVWAHGIIL